MFNLGAFLSYAFVVSFTPGPNNILSMLNGSKHGYKKTFGFIIGVTSGFFIIMLLSCYFNRALMQVIPMIKPVISFVGASYLIYLALKILGVKVFKGKDKKEEDRDNTVNSFRVGFLMQFLNPKAILYGLTIVANFITPYFDTHYQLYLAALFLALIGFLSVSSWALFGTLFNKIINEHKVAFNYTMSGLLVYSALAVAGIL